MSFESNTPVFRCRQSYELRAHLILGEIQPTSEQRAALFAVVQERHKTSEKISVGSVSARFKFELENGSITLRRGVSATELLVQRSTETMGGTDRTVSQPDNKNSCNLAQLNFTSLHLKFEQKPGLKGFLLETSIATMVVKDLFTVQSHFRDLVGPKTNSHERPVPNGPVPVPTESFSESVRTDDAVVRPSPWPGSAAVGFGPRTEVQRPSVTDRLPLSGVSDSNAARSFNPSCSVLQPPRYSCSHLTEMNSDHSAQPSHAAHQGIHHC